MQEGNGSYGYSLIVGGIFINMRCPPNTLGNFSECFTNFKFMLTLCFMMGKAYGWGTFTFPKCKDGLNQMFGPIDESRLMVIVWVIGLKLQVTTEQFLLQCAAMN